MTKKRLAAFAFALFCLALPAPKAEARPGRQLKFEGVPAAQIAQLKKRFPTVFDRDVTLAEVDQALRYLMSTKSFANIEVVERGPSDQRELVLVGSLVRRIAEIEIKGSRHVNRDELMSILGISKGQTFERKDLVAAADQLQEVYGKAGYLNARIEIDFSLPSETEVKVMVSIVEGPPCKVVEINFETPNKELAERAKKMSRSLLNKPLSEENVMTFQKSLTDYFSQNRYLTARLSQPAIVYNNDRSQSKLTYLIESAYKYEFVFDGINYFEPGTILRRIELDKLFGLTTSPAADLADRTRKLFHNTGFPNVEIEYKEKIFEESQKYQIKFEIREHERVRIAKIDVSGNISRSPSYYAKFITNHSSELIQRGYYNRKDVESGYENLKVELQNQGYLRARVQSVRTEYSKNRTQVTVFVNLDEGPLTQIRQVKFEGANAFSKAQLTEISQIHSNSPLSLNDLSSSLARVKEFYRSQGYLEMKILNEKTNEGPDALVVYNETNTQAVVSIKIDEGPKVIVSSIAVSGNTFTKAYVVLRELEFKIGDTLTPEKIDDSVNRLQRMGLFSRVEIRTIEEGTNTSERTVEVIVQDRDPGLFSSGIGITNERGIDQEGVTVRGYLGVAYRNLGGTARGVAGRVALEYSTDPSIAFLGNEMTLSYLEPYVFGARNRGRVNVFREQGFSHKEENAVVIQEENGISLQIERDLTRHLKLTQTVWSFSNQRKFVLDGDDNKTIENQNVAKVGTHFTYDRRDSPFLPMRGYYTTLGLEYSDPILGSSNDADQLIRFNKFTTAFTHYWKMFKSNRIVWENTARSGYMANLSNDPVAYVPSTEIFFLGGRSTIRGFDQSDLGRIPNRIQLGVDEERKFKLKGDSHYYLIKSDLRLPLYSDWLDFILFYDGGAVLITKTPGVNIKDSYRDSAGFGFRINTPVGPIKLDVGFKLDRKDWGAAGKESEKAIHLSFGTF